MHTNHRRKNKQDYPWDNRGWKCKDHNRYMRARERHCLNRILQGDDPDDMAWPLHPREVDDVWSYD